MPTGQDVIDAARKYIGVKWQHQGRSKFGIDCVGLIVKTAEDLNIPAEDHRGYHRYPDGHLLLKLLREQCTEIPVSEAKMGDILIIMGNHKRPMHAAFKVDDTTILHAWLYRRKVVESGFEQFEDITAAFRFKEAI